MKDSLPRVTLKPRFNSCSSIVKWDNESLILTLSLNHQEDSESKEYKLARTIDEQLGIIKSDFRIILGEMDILLDTNQYITSMQIRTNPSNWLQVSLPSVPNNLDPVFPIFQVEYDENYIVSYTVPIQIMQDVPQQQLSFLFGDYISSRWVNIADGVVLGLTLDLFLSEIRLLDIDLPQN